jgi:hypothetical protein
MRIQLIYPSWTGEYGRLARLARKAGKWPPLNLAYLAAYAEAGGHQVSIIDGEAEGISLLETVSCVRQYDPDLIGITATTPFYHVATSLATLIKSYGIKAPIAIGGPHLTAKRMCPGRRFSPRWRTETAANPFAGCSTGTAPGQSLPVRQIHARISTVSRSHLGICFAMTFTVLARCGDAFHSPRS